MRRTAGLLVVVLLLWSVTAALAQTDEDQAKALINGLKTDIAKGDLDAVAKLISESGFVGVIEFAGEAKCCDRKEFIDLLREAVPAGGMGAELKVDDLKVDVRYTVAFANAKLSLPGQAPEQKTFLDAVAFRELGKWQLCALMVSDQETKPDQTAVEGLVARMAALPEAVKAGNTEPLAKALDDNHFILCLLDPTGELRWADGKQHVMQLVQMIAGQLTVNQSKLEVSRTQTGQACGVMDGKWLLDIPEFGQLNLDVRAYAVKTGDEWKVVAIAGAPAK